MEAEIRSESDVNDLAKLVQGYACDLWALENFPSLEPASVDSVGDTQNPSFYTEYNQYMQLEPAEVNLAQQFQREGIDLGHQFDWISEEFAKRAVYDTGPYATVLGELRTVLGKLEIGTLSLPFEDAADLINDGGVAEPEAFGVPDSWDGDFVDSLNNDVLRFVPHHRPHHYILVFQLIAAVRAQMTLHESYRSRLYDIAMCTRNKIRSVIYGPDVSTEFTVATRIIGIVLAILGTIKDIATLDTTGATMTLSALGSGLTAVRDTELIKGDFAKAQEEAEPPTGNITGSTSAEITDSMMTEINRLDEEIRAEESGLASKIGAALGSLADVVAAADQTTGLTADWSPWMVRAKRTYLADHQPDEHHEMSHTASDYLD